MKTTHFLHACILGCAVALPLLSCTKTETAGYTITGTAEGTQDGDTVYICEMQGFFAMNPVDTTVIKGGKFSFEGQTEGASLRFLVPMHAGKPTAMGMFILENADIKATLKIKPEETVIEGGPNQKLYDEYTAGDNEINKQMEEPWRMANDSTATAEARQAAQLTVDSLTKVAKDHRIKFVKDHVPSAFSDMMLAFIMQELTDEELNDLLKLLGEKQPQYPVYKAIMAERKATEASAVGAHYTDFEMPGTDGKPLKVSAFVDSNKLTLIDFWASWCGPCRAEMPTVVKAYADYHAKGFEVVGVSLDNDKEAWLKAIAQLKMPWPHMSDLKGWESEGAKLYNVQSIPANVLVDQQGNILARDLRGDDLLNKLAELLK